MPLPNPDIVKEMLQLYVDTRTKGWNTPQGYLEAGFQAIKNVLYDQKLEADSTKKIKIIENLNIKATEAYNLKSWLEFCFTLLSHARKFGKCLFSDTLILIRSDILATLVSQEDDVKKDFNAIIQSLDKQKQDLQKELDEIDNHHYGRGSEKLIEDINNITLTLAYYYHDASIKEAQKGNLLNDLHILTEDERTKYTRATKFYFYSSLPPLHHHRPFWLQPAVHVYIYALEYQTIQLNLYPQWKQRMEEKSKLAAQNPRTSAPFSAIITDEYSAAHNLLFFSAKEDSPQAQDPEEIFENDSTRENQVALSN